MQSLYHILILLWTFNTSATIIAKVKPLPVREAIKIPFPTDESILSKESKKIIADYVKYKNKDKSKQIVIRSYEGKKNLILSYVIPLNRYNVILRELLLNGIQFQNIKKQTIKIKDKTIPCNNNVNLSCNMEIAILERKARKLKPLNKTKEDKYEENINNTLKFKVAHFNITKRHRKSLLKWTKKMKSDPNYNMIIEGFADNRGTALLNNELSKARSLEVFHYLVRHRISANRFIIKSYGSRRLLPRLPGESKREFNFKQNRVILTYYNTNIKIKKRKSIPPKKKKNTFQKNK